MSQFGFDVFKNQRYRNFWISNTASNGAIWMQNMACAIILTHLSTSPFTNALVQVAATLPLFLFGIFAGIAGDRFDKYRVLTIAQLCLAMLSLMLAMLAFKNFITPWIFILMTFFFATATTFRMPVSQAGIIATVAEGQIKYAAIMNNLSFNLCRTLGPALAGLLIAFLPYYGVFFLSSVILGLVTLNFFSQSKQRISVSKTKMPYKICFNRIIKDSIFLACGLDAFFIFFSGSLIWALMPYFARYELNENAGGQGALMAFIGVGALMTVFVLPPLIKQLSRHVILLCCYILLLLAFIAIRFTYQHGSIPVAIALALFGLGWSMSVASLNGLIQSRFTKDIATRAISLYLMIMYFSQFAGSLWAGCISEKLSINFAMFVSIVLLILGVIVKTSVIIKAR